MALSPAFAERVRAVKEAAPIAEVVSDYVQLKRAGKNLLGLCPFPDHRERTPSFNVNPEKRLFKCFGCGRAGDVFKFLQEIEGIGFVEAVERVAHRFGLPFDRGSAADRAEDARRRRLADLFAAAAQIFRTGFGQGEAGRRAADYLRRRGVGDAMVERFGLGWSPVGDETLARGLKRAGFSYEEMHAAGLLAGNSTLSRFGGRVVFPIRDRLGRVVAFGGRLVEGTGPKYLNSPDNPLFDKSRILFGLNLAAPRIKETGRAIVVEGYMDLIALHSAGLEETVAPLGTSLTARHVGALVKLADRVVLFLDSDEAGLSAALRVGREFAGFDHEPFVVTLGAAAKDPDEFLKRYGAKMLLERIEKAPPYLDFVLSTLAGKVDLGTTAGRARAAREFIAPLLRTDSPLKRGDYARRAAEFLKVSVGDFAELARAAAPSAPSGAAPARRAREPEPLVKELLQALLARPDLAPELEAARASGEVELPGEEVAALLPLFLERAAGGSAERLEEALTTHPLAALVSSLRMEPHQDAAKLFAGALARLRRDRIDRELVALDREMKKLEKTGDIGKMKDLQKRYMELARKRAK